MKSLLSGYGQGIMQQSPQCASYERIERDHQDLRQKNQSQVYGGYGDKSQFRSNYEQFYWYGYNLIWSRFYSILYVVPDNKKQSL